MPLLIMHLKYSICRLLASLLIVLPTLNNLEAQTANEPEKQQLLNGLRILYWPRPNTDQVLVKLRIHSGAAFDLAGKSGEMSLLGDILFPDPATVDFFTDEMGGKLDVIVNYDSLTITMVGKTAQFEQIIEVLRNAILATQFTPEIVTRTRDARIKISRDTPVTSATIADRAIATRLFGDFPYARPFSGSVEDLARVERGDLMLVKDRFLNSNNATLAVVGGVTQARAMRTVRQLLGPWRKSEQIVPTTFRLPPLPDPKTLLINNPGPDVQIRVAVRGIARSDPDFYASQLLAKLVHHRWLATDSQLASKPTFVRSDAYVLPGMFVMGALANTQTVAESITSAEKALQSMSTGLVTPAELERARNEIVAETTAALAQPDTRPDPWLDLDTYRLDSIQNPVTVYQSMTPADLQRVAGRLLKDGGFATVVVGDTLLLKPALQGRLQFEVLGDPVPAATPKPAAKPGTSTSPS